VYDFGTKWIDCICTKSRNETDTVAAFKEYAGSKAVVKEFYSDKGAELISSAKILGWTHATATPGMPRTNSIAESKVKLVLNGARCLLAQAGLQARFWPFAVRCFCFYMNMEVRRGDSAYNKRHKFGHFSGQVLPFGCLVDYYPTLSTRANAPTLSIGY
jgi:hypothetical protein